MMITTPMLYRRRDSGKNVILRRRRQRRLTVTSLTCARTRPTWIIVWKLKRRNNGDDFFVDFSSGSYLHSVTIWLDYFVQDVDIYNNINLPKSIQNLPEHALNPKKMAKDY